MFIQAKVLITIAAITLVNTSVALGLTSAVWNLVALPATLSLLLLVLAAYEYYETIAEKHQAKVHCLLKHLSKKQNSQKNFHQDAA